MYIYIYIYIYMYHRIRGGRPASLRGRVRSPSCRGRPGAAPEVHHGRGSSPLYVGQFPAF